MMDFEEFTGNILRAVSAKADGAFQVRKDEVVKNNNVKRTGISVVKEEAAVGLRVYLDGLYREYESGGMKFDEAVDEAYRLALEYGEDTPDADIPGFCRWETVHKDIYPKLVNAKQNKELLEKMPHRNFMDLAVVYYAVARDHAQEDIGTIPVHNGHMEMWGLEEENLYQTAMMNMRADGEAVFITLETMVKRILPGIALPEKGGNALRNTGMYILTNRRRRFGAAEILDKKTLRMVADKVGDGFTVLPSSLHESIVLPAREEAEYGRLADMVREVNDTQVDAEERLSYHVYVYSRDDEMLKIVV